MSLEVFSSVWNRSPYTGTKLLLHLALAEHCSSTRAEDSGLIDLSELRHKGRCRDRLSVEEHLAEMRDDGHLEFEGKLFNEDSEKPWGYIEYTLYLHELIADRTEEAHKELVRKYNSLQEEHQKVLAGEIVKGYVYLLRCGSYYKIGHTTNLDKRVTQLAIQLPHKPEILHTIATQTPLQLEQFLHSQFAQKRRNGEWFELDDTDIGRISVWSRMDRNETND